jgi:D-psicose/D-tagatose/L-ribulose 3-epimerase
MAENGVRFGMHSSLWTAAWTREAAERVVPTAARHGLDVIEIALLNPVAVDAAHSRALFERHGVAPTCSLGLPAEACAPLHPEKAERFLMNALDVAHALGSSTLTGVTYSTLGYTTGTSPTEAEYATIEQVLRPVARRAAELGMTLGLEPCNRYETHLLNTAEQTVGLIERVGEPALMIHLDTYHMNIEEKGFKSGIEKAGKHLNYIHLSESDRGVPGTGTVDFAATMAALAATGFQGDIVGEAFINMPPELARALSVWRPVARSAEEVLDPGMTYLKRLAVEHGLVRG